MKQFKVLMIYLINAQDRKEAVKIFANAKEAGREDNLFEVQIVKEVEDTGWLGTISKQLHGK